MPFKLPEIESDSDSETQRNDNVLVPPRQQQPGLSLWLTLAPGRSVLSLDAATCERFRALGYVGKC